ERPAFDLRNRAGSPLSSALSAPGPATPPADPTRHARARAPRRPLRTPHLRPRSARNACDAFRPPLNQAVGLEFLVTADTSTLLFQVLSLKFAGTAYLDDDGTFLRSDEVRDAGVDDDETTPRVAS